LFDTEDTEAQRDRDHRAYVEPTGRESPGSVPFEVLDLAFVLLGQLA